MKRDKSNPVAKNLNKYNKPATHTDRKKAMKKGEVKHKKSILKDDEQQTDTSNRTNSAAKKPQNYVDPATGKTKTRMVPVHKDVQTEKLNPSDGIRAYIDDFQKSDAPQFQGKSKEKRREMAIAAYLDAKRGTKKESTVEQVDELSKKTLGSYIKKSTASAADHSAKSSGHTLAKNIAGFSSDKAKHAKTSDDHLKKVNKRTDGIERAANRLTKDKNKSKYIKKSAYNAVDHAKHAGLATANIRTSGDRQHQAAKAHAGEVKKRYTGISRMTNKLAKEEVEQEAYNPRAARAQSHAANKMYGRQYPEQDKPKTGVTKQAKSGKAAKADLFRALDKKYGDPKKKTGIYAKEAVDPSDSGGAEEVNMAVKQIAAMRHFLDGIESRVKKAGDMEEWYQNKLTKANDYLKTLYSYGKGDVAESMDPRDFTDKPGHVVVVTKPSGHKAIKQYHATSAGAKKYADRINKTNKVGHKATVHKTDGRKIHEEQDPLLADENPVTENGQDFVVEQEVHARYMRVHGKKASGHGRWAFTTSRHGQSQPGQTFVHTGNFSDAHKKAKKHFGKPVYVMEEVEQVDEASQKLANKRAELRKKMFGDANYLTPAQRKELDKAAKAELKKEREAKKASPAPKTTTKTAKGKIHTGRADPADQNIFMQFRKAQDAAKASGRKMHNIKVGPKSTVSVPTSLVNKALAKHDSLSKPEDKRRLKIQLIKALRAKAK